MIPVNAGDGRRYTNVGVRATGNSSVAVGGNVTAATNVGRTADPDPPTNRQRGTSPADRARGEDATGADVGVLTVLGEEVRAVVEVLRRHDHYSCEQAPGGADVHRAEVRVPGGALRVVAMQTLDRGPRSAAVAFGQLQTMCAPPVVLLVGIAGAVHRDLRVGDVVISDEVVYYDSRRVAADGTHRRGQSHPVSAQLRHRINAFFQRYGARIDAPDGKRFAVRHGPIGSGDAVVTDASSDIRTYLRGFNEKTLAVETEAGGVGQACYEHIGPIAGWLTIRGISDRADARKGHRDHQLASDRAAQVMELMLPLLDLRRTKE
jgi:adenosylhomocysteine nucleosidase